MLTLQWRAAHAVFVDEIDDDHAEIFESLTALKDALAARSMRSTIRKHSEALAARMEGHFAHEERLMRAARYDSYRWHKGKHEAALKQAREFLERIQQGDRGAGPELVEYLTSWLHDHTRMADMMLGAFLRNSERGLYKVTFHAGTKPASAGGWVDSKGDRFDPSAPASKGY
jgi:hemerythrin-like metal-binding protein